MMMSKPRPQVEETTSKTEGVVKKSPEDTVKDLERRLELLGGGATTPTNAPTGSAPVAMGDEEAAKPEAQAAAVKGGKNALLARIMAAQERAKSAQQPKPAEEQPQEVDLLSSEFDAPPAFDAAALPPAQAAPPPPSFDVFEETAAKQTPPPPMSDPPAMTAPVMIPSAPSFEDLLDSQAAVQQAAAAQSYQHLAGVTQVVPPPPPPPPPAEEEFAGLEGLSEEERIALLEEQRKIMEEIERQKKSKEQSLADAFDQRSSAAVVQALSQGSAATVSQMPGSSTSGTTVTLGSGQEATIRSQEKSQAAIQDGTALLVQCTSCQNWMQVTKDAALMYCPVCSTVTPVEVDTSGLTRQEAMQEAADRQMAEQLQNEEYKRAEGAPRRQQASSASSPSAQETASEKGGSWWDWLTGSTPAETSASPTRPAPQASQPLARGDMGVSRPPGGGLSAARTGEEAETITFGEHEGLIGHTTAGGARIAEQKPLFSCVVDSVSTAATSLSTAIQTQTLGEDQEGNVHGVDASSLLTVTKASRNDQPYDRM